MEETERCRREWAGTKGPWREGGHRGNAPGGPLLSGEGGAAGAARAALSAQGHQAPHEGPERRREARGAAAVPPISRASCPRALRRKRGALLGPGPQQIAAVLQYPRTLAQSHWHRLGLGNSCAVPMATRQRLPPPPAEGPPRPARRPPASLASSPT